MIKKFPTLWSVFVVLHESVVDYFLFAKKTTADFQQKSAVCMNKNRVILGKHIY